MGANVASLQFIKSTGIFCIYRLPSHIFLEILILIDKLGRSSFLHCALIPFTFSKMLRQCYIF